MTEGFIYRWLFIIGMFISGCGTLYKGPGIYHKNPDFGAYTNAYQEYREIYLGDRNVSHPIDIDYGYLEEPIVGSCRIYDNGIRPRVLIIDYTYWQEVDDERRLRLIFHELAHCDLTCGHQEEVDGIMNSHLGYGKVTDEEIQAMFTECK